MYQFNMHMGIAMKLYNIAWTQSYSTWPVEDLRAAREVLARIMAL